MDVHPRVPHVDNLYIWSMPAASSADLALLPLFEGLSGDELAEIAVWFEVKDVDRGVRLVGEGATGHSFFLFSRGEAVVTARGEDVASLGPGDFFGEMAFFGAGRRRATVTTTSPARVVVLFGDDFERLRTAYPAVAARIAAAVERRLGELPS